MKKEVLSLADVLKNMLALEFGVALEAIEVKVSTTHSDESEHVHFELSLEGRPAPPTWGVFIEEVLEEELALVDPALEGAIHDIRHGEGVALDDDEDPDAGRQLFALMAAGLA